LLHGQIQPLLPTLREISRLNGSKTASRANTQRARVEDTII